MHRLAERDTALWTLWALAAAIVCGAILYGYYDHFWHSRDEGYFAHAAERLLQGEVLHRDIGTPHTGIIHFLHALSFQIFGVDLVSLRILPAISTWVQAGLIFYILRARGPIAAFAGALAFSAAAFPLFPSPTQHWACLFLVVATMAVVTEWPGLSWRKLLVLGVFCGLVFGLRQPTGVFLAMAVSTVCFLQKSETSPRPDREILSQFLAPVFLLLFAGLLALYVRSAFDAVSMLLFAWAPLLLLVRVALSLRVVNRDALTIAACLLAGAMLPLGTLVMYHVFHGSLGDWAANSIGSALFLSSLGYVGADSYASYLIGPVIAALQVQTPGAIAMSVLWVGLLLAAPLVGIVLHRRLYSGHLSSRDRGLLILAVFYFLVAGHHPDRVYFAYILAPVLLGVILITPMRVARRAGVLVGATALAMLFFQGAQPYERGQLGDFIGLRVETQTRLNLARGGLHVTAAEARFHEDLVQFIQAHSDPDEPILALPGNADLHFLADRPNPLPGVMPVYSVYDEELLRDTLQTLRETPPRVVIHVPYLPYNTVWTDRIMQHVTCDYALAGDIGGFVLYILDTDQPFHGRDQTCDGRTGSFSAAAASQ
ncbi:MAG: hypothetical protein AAFN09_14895 [Pseudomonadota bacterium]